MNDRYNAERDNATGLLNGQAIRAFSSRLADSVACLVQSGRFPVVLGGDCSTLLGLRDSARDQLDWYRGAGRTGPIVARASPMLADAQYATPPTTRTEPSVRDDLTHAADEGVDEVHWDLNIVGLEPHRQVDALEALTSALGYPHG